MANGFHATSPNRYQWWNTLVGMHLASLVLGSLFSRCCQPARPRILRAHNSSLCVIRTWQSKAGVPASATTHDCINNKRSNFGYHLRRASASSWLHHVWFIAKDGNLFAPVCIWFFNSQFFVPFATTLCWNGHVWLFVGRKVKILGKYNTLFSYGRWGYKFKFWAKVKKRSIKGQIMPFFMSAIVWRLCN